MGRKFFLPYFSHFYRRFRRPPARFLGHIPEDKICGTVTLEEPASANIVGFFSHLHLAKQLHSISCFLLTIKEVNLNVNVEPHCGTVIVALEFANIVGFVPQFHSRSLLRRILLALCNPHFRATQILQVHLLIWSVPREWIFNRLNLLVMACMAALLL